jgi:hypothetical protein
MARSAAFIFVALFFTALGILTFSMHLIPLFIIILYAATSAITFIAYAIDKSAASHPQTPAPCGESIFLNTVSAVHSAPISLA